MWDYAKRVVDYFVPPQARDEWSSYMMVRTFVFLHLFGPLLGHSVIFFLYSASEEIGWVFWALEINLCFFWLMPFLLFIMLTRHWRRDGWAVAGRRESPRLERELDEHRVYVDGIERRVAELEERLDFTERLLAGRPETGS